MDLKGKVCLVTGGTSGIGAATALTLARKGAHVAIVARRAAPLPEDLLSAVERHGTTARSFEADVADPEACRKSVEQVVKDFGRLDVLVHSAGGPVRGSIYAVTDESWMNAFAVHVHSIFHLTRAAAPHMAQQGGGAIILLGSVARELAEQRIRVNCISPGVIRTPFQDSLSPGQVKNNIENRIPLHQEGKPEDVAELITSVVENDFITGENMV